MGKKQWHVDLIIVHIASKQHCLLQKGLLQIHPLGYACDSIDDTAPSIVRYTCHPYRFTATLEGNPILPRSLLHPSSVHQMAHSQYP
jgi:hypothetical protein